MTSTTGTDEHPDVAEISALTEGLLAPERIIAVRAHMVACEPCAEVGSSLEEIRTLLGTLPGPARMPDDVAGRIDAALAAEALLDSTAPEPVSRGTLPGDTGDTGHDAASAGQNFVSRETSLPTGTSTAPADTVGPPGRPDTSRPSRGTRRPWSRRDTTGPGGRPRARRWRGAVLGAAAVLGFGIGGAVLVQSIVPANEDDAAAGRSVRTTDSASSTTDGLNAAALEGRVQQLLAGTAPEKGSSDSVGAQTSQPNPLRGVAVPPCVRNGIDSMAEPLAAEEDVFEGKEAFIVVMPHRSDATRVDAYVVDATCVGTQPSKAGDILLNRSYPRR